MRRQICSRPRLVGLFLFVILCLPLAFPAVAADDGPAWLNKALSRYIQRHNLAYATLHIKTPDQTWQHRIAAPDLQKLLPDHTLPAIGQARYRWGEIAHIWLSLAALALEDQGKLDSAAKANRYLYGEPYNSVGNLKNVTLTDLITQDAAIADYSDNSAFFRRVMKNGTASHWTRDALVKLVTELPAYDQPGKAAWLSKSHGLLLALAMERMTGQSWQNLARDIVLKQAGLKNTGFGRNQQNLAPGIQDIDFAEDGAQELLDNRSLAQDIPGQDLAGSAEDLDHFLRWLIQSDSKPALLLRGLASQHLDGGGTGLTTLPDFPTASWNIFGHQPGWQAESLFLPEKNISVTLLSSGGAAPSIVPAIASLIQACTCIPDQPNPVPEQPASSRN